MTRIYTRTGDAGETALFGGKRVSKDDLRVRAYGTVDELNAVVGVARAAGPTPEIDAVLERVQHHLFDLGAELATPGGTSPAVARVPRATAERVAGLEQDIDRFDARLPPLREFVLPGGVAATAAAVPPAGTAASDRRSTSAFRSTPRTRGCALPPR